MHDNLTHLALDATTDTDNLSVLASNTHLLRQLVSFRNRCLFTHQVVQQLALDCCERQEVAVSELRTVSDCSVAQIQKLENLND